MAEKTQKKEIKYTPMQKAVIDEKNKNLLVSASAGSGKTFVMIQRIIRQIIDKEASVSEMLICTFTNSAASEMKTKLTEQLSAVEPKTDYIKSQLNEINMATICTIHSFCAKLLRTYFYEVGLDPSFALVDEVESGTLKQKALDKLISAELEKNNKLFYELLDIFSLNRNDENFKDVILKLYDFLQTQIDEEAYIKKTLALFDVKKLNDSIFAEIINKYAIEKTAALRAEGKVLREECALVGMVKFVEILDTIDSNLHMVRPDNKFLENQKALSNLQKVPGLRGGEDQELLKAKLKAYKAKVSDSKGFFDQLKALYGTDTEKRALEKMRILEKRISYLWSMVLDFEKFYAELKQEKVALDFNDLEKYTIQLLNIKAVQKEVQEKYKYVFVDEYQDTNLVQEEIISKVKSSKNLFMVGDIKQSIYGFRASEPQIFIDKYDAYKADRSGNNRLIMLNDNFRSHQDILAFANLVFDRVMTKEFGNLDYKTDARLNRGGAPMPSNPDFPTVKIELITDNGSTEGQAQKLGLYSVLNHEGPETEAIKNASAEGKVVAKDIKKLITTCIADPSSVSGESYVQYKDITILTATRGDYLEYFLQELEAENIPYSTDVANDIFEDKNLLQVKNFLSVVDNFSQDMPLLSVLQSPIFDFSADELATVRIADRESEHFYDALALYAQSSEQGAVRQKVQKVLKTLREFNFLSKTTTVDKLINLFLERFEYENYLLKCPMGSRSLTNLKKLIGYLSGKPYNASLSKFLNAVTETPITFGADFAENSVKVTTIHKSKGLEYKIVFVIGCGRRLNDKRNQMVISKNLGVSMGHFDPSSKTKSDTISKRAILLENDRKTIEEKARLLYVALTRPKNHLILVGVYSGEEDKSPENAKCFFDWIMPSVRVSENASYLSVESVDMSALKSDRQAAETTAKPVTFTKPDEVLRGRIGEVFDYAYGYSKFVDMPTKTTVSEILKEDSEAEVFVPNLFVVGNSKAIEKGNAYHKLMQHINFDICKKTFVLNDLMGAMSGILTAEERAYINVDELARFLRDPITVGLLSRKLIREQEFIALMNPPNSKAEDGMVLQGIVDLICEGENDLVIVDYKTNSWTDEKRYIEHYGKQVEIYARVTSEAMRKKVSKKYLYSFTIGKYIEIK